MLHNNQRQPSFESKSANSFPFPWIFQIPEENIFEPKRKSFGEKIHRVLNKLKGRVWGRKKWSQCNVIKKVMTSEVFAHTGTLSTSVWIWVTGLCNISSTLFLLRRNVCFGRDCLVNILATNTEEYYFQFNPGLTQNTGEFCHWGGTKKSVLFSSNLQSADHNIPKL